MNYSIENAAKTVTDSKLAFFKAQELIERGETLDYALMATGLKESQYYGYLGKYKQSKLVRLDGTPIVPKKAGIATPMPKRSAGTGDAYVRFSLKSLYISSQAMELIPNTERINISVNAKGHSMVISKGDGKNSFHLCRVNETKCARRIDTVNALLSLVDAGYPKWALGKRMPAMAGLDGSLVVDLRPQIPLEVQNG